MGINNTIIFNYSKEKAMLSTNLKCMWDLSVGSYRTLIQKL